MVFHLVVIPEPLLDGSLDDFVATPGIEEFRYQDAGCKIKDGGQSLCSMVCLGWN
jgi:hypothetical protein